MRRELAHEILMARKRVYAVAQPTPLERLSLGIDAQVYLKREDLSPIHSYKWRGAYNRMAALTEAERARGAVCASAGNHAQGVALAAQRLNMQARIYMPQSTPRTKQAAVLHHGAGHVEVRLVGDRYDDAAAAAAEDVGGSGAVYVHPFDDLLIMAGQGTLADEMVMSGQGPFDVVYLQIGGGGMAAAVACWLKLHYPETHIVGVEGQNQASMAAAVHAGRVVPLEYVDIFCDGTAVRQAGALTYPLCAELIDEFITVTNEEVSAAVELLWNARRIIAEPSGAMGIAGLMKQAETLNGRKAAAVLCGANVDFERLVWIAQHAGIGAKRRRYYRLEMAEAPGGLLALLNNVLEGMNIVDVQYGKTHSERAWPVIGFEGTPIEFEALERVLTERSISHDIVTSEEDVEFRIINYEPDLFHDPYFVTIDFPERPGALRDFLEAVQGTTNVCYFNYTFSGESIGRALIGFEFTSTDSREEFLGRLESCPMNYRELRPSALARIL